MNSDIDNYFVKCNLGNVVEKQNRGDFIMPAPTTFGVVVGSHDEISN